MRGSDSAERTGGRRFEIIFNYLSLIGTFLMRMPVWKWRLSTASREWSQCTGATRGSFLEWQFLSIVLSSYRKNALDYPRFHLRLAHIKKQLKSRQNLDEGNRQTSVMWTFSRPQISPYGQKNIPIGNSQNWSSTEVEILNFTPHTTHTKLKARKFPIEKYL